MIHSCLLNEWSEKKSLTGKGRFSFKGMSWRRNAAMLRLVAIAEIILLYRSARAVPEAG